jgi:hypothetical protein
MGGFKMSTRSLTYIHETEKSEPFVCIYRQCDGYPEGIGNDLKKILSGFKIVSGYNGDDSNCATCNKASWEHKQSVHAFQPKRVANGINCLAAWVVKGLKDSIGNVYLYPAKTKDAGQEYEYHLYLSKQVPMLKVLESGHKAYKDEPAIPAVTLYSGTLEDFTPEACKESAEAKLAATAGKE